MGLLWGFFVRDKDSNNILRTKRNYIVGSGRVQGFFVGSLCRKISEFYLESKVYLGGQELQG